MQFCNQWRDKFCSWSSERASFYAAECRQKLFNEFDSQFLIPLKNTWIEQQGDKLTGLSDQDKENQFMNE